MQNFLIPTDIRISEQDKPTTVKSSLRFLKVTLEFNISEGNMGYFSVDGLTLGQSNLTFWLRDAPTSLTFNNCTFCPHCIYVLCKQRLVLLTA
jgi:hypothetical protein